MTQSPAETNAAHLLLASASPRRRELVALLGLPFEVVASDYDEPPPPSHAVHLPSYAMELAAGKAAGAVRGEHTGAAIGADTIVSISDTEWGVPLGKPVDRAHGMSMLRALSGRAHSVYTGIAVAGPGAAPRTDCVRTLVTFRDLTDAMIEDYLNTNEPFDKAGAYGAQGYAAPFIREIQGDYFNVVGLPLCALGILLEKCGILWWQHRGHMPPVIG